MSFFFLQQIKSKRSQDCDSGNCQYRTEKESRVYKEPPTTMTTTTMKMFPDINRDKSRLSSTKKPEVIRNQKRSTADHKKNIVSDEESLARQLNSLRHIRNWILKWIFLRGFVTIILSPTAEFAAFPCCLLFFSNKKFFRVNSLCKNNFTYVFSL